jgi:hypothetical protein
MERFVDGLRQGEQFQRLLDIGFSAGEKSLFIPNLKVLP